MDYCRRSAFQKEIFTRRSKKSSFAFPFSFLLYLAVLFATVNLSLATTEIITDKIAKIINSTYIPAENYSILIYDYAAGEYIFSINPKKMLIPASNQKLITTIAGLARLGEDFKFTTLLVMQKDTSLAIIADGDPAFGQYTDEDSFILTTWARALKENGIDKIDNLYIDMSVFDDEYFHPNWPEDQLYRTYTAPISGLVINKNLLWAEVSLNPTPTFKIYPQLSDIKIDVEWIHRREANQTIINPIWLSEDSLKVYITFGGRPVGPVSFSVYEPVRFLKAVIKRYLQVKDNLTVRLETIRDIDGQIPKESKILQVYKTPIWEVIAEANKDSINIYAECLFKRQGFEFAKGLVSFPVGSWITGRLAIEEFLANNLPQIDRSEIIISDGCGLSRENRITTHAIVELLNYAYSRWRDNFLKTLAIAGTDGTLQRRMERIRGKVFAKTGYIRSVSALSGYIVDEDNNVRFIFSMIFNDFPPGKLWVIKKLQERICEELATCGYNYTDNP